MKTLFRTYLKNRGITISGEDADSISFKNGNYNYIFISGDTDPYYFRLILPHIFDVNSENRTSVTDKINELNIYFKAAKATIISNVEVWVSIEQFVYCTNNIDDLFNRSMNVLEAFAEKFNNEIRA